MLTDLIAILLGVVVMNNCVLPGSLVAAITPDASLHREALPHLALLLPLVVATAGALSWLLGGQLLVPLRLAELQPLVLVTVTALAVQPIARLHHRLVPRQGPLLRALLTFNAVAAGLAQGAILPADDLSAAIIGGLWLGAALGILNLCFAWLGTRLDQAGPAGRLHGAGIRLVSAGILSLGLGGLAGIWRG